MDQHTHGAPKAPEGVALLGLLAFEGVEDTLVLASDLGEDARLDVGDEVPGGGLLGVHVGGDASPPGASYSVPICANMSAARYMAYQRCTTYFFSGTGNSMRVASWLGETARAPGRETVVSPLTAAQPERELEASPGQLLLLCMPTHGFTASWHMIRFAARLPRGGGAHVAVTATRAGIKIGRWQPPGMSATTTFLIGPRSGAIACGAC